MKNLLNNIWGMEASAFKAFIMSQVLSALLACVILIIIIQSFMYVRDRLYFKEPILPQRIAKLFNAIKLYVGRGKR